MRMILGAAALTLLAGAPALAQPQYGAPRGSYERQCTDIRMNGQFLSATCRGARGGGQSSINVASCASDIGVDATGALSCTGPGADAPAPPAPPAYREQVGRGYRPDTRPGEDSDRRYGGRGFRAVSVTVFARPNSRGPSARIDGDTPNLASTGLNDRVRSIELPSGSVAWLVCSDANFRGRCVTVDRSVRDTRAIGLRDSISSLRPLYGDRRY